MQRRMIFSATGGAYALAIVASRRLDAPRSTSDWARRFSQRARFSAARICSSSALISPHRCGVNPARRSKSNSVVKSVAARPRPTANAATLGRLRFSSDRALA